MVGVAEEVTTAGPPEVHPTPQGVPLVPTRMVLCTANGPQPLPLLPTVFPEDRSQKSAMVFRT